MKMIFLDDEEVRHSYMREMLPGIIGHRRPDDTIEELKNADIDVLFLDHDLSRYVEGSGLTVAKWLGTSDQIAMCALPERLDLIVLHSYNAAGCKNMKDALAHRYNVRIEPFRSMGFISLVGKLKEKMVKENKKKK